MKQTKRIFNFPKPVNDALVKEAAKRGQSLTTIVIEALRQYFGMDVK